MLDAIRVSRNRASLGAVSSIAGIAMLAVLFVPAPCVAGTGAIPGIVIDGHTFVAVEPLLQSLQIGYDIKGTSLTVDGRAYPHALLEHGGADFVGATDIASFLHLTIVRRNGVIVFSSEQTPSVTGVVIPEQQDLDALRGELLDALNEHRREIGIAPLVMDKIAAEAAQAHAEDMARAAVIQHGDARGRSPMERYAALGGKAHAYAENVGWYGLDVTSRVDLWTAISKLDKDMMAEIPPDDGHRENILSHTYAAVGIGVATGPSGVYLTEDFSGK